MSTVCDNTSLVHNINFRTHIKLTTVEFVWAVFTLWYSVTTHASFYTVAIITRVLVSAAGF